MLKVLAVLCLVAAVQSASIPKYYGEVVFLGDSITDWWKNEGRNVWAQYYEPKGAVNTGVAGDTTQQVIDRIAGGMIDNYQARVAVLMIGTNDLGRNIGESQVSDQITRIIGILQAYFPGVKIILLGIFPRNGADIHQRIRNVNEMIKNLDNGNNVRYLNMETQFSQGLGQTRPGLFTDGLHLTEAGYRVWAETMAPLFNSLIA